MTTKAAFLFPGQGTDLSRLDTALLDLQGPVRTLVDHVGGLLKLDLVSLVKQGAPCLTKTEVAQPTIVAITLGLALARARTEPADLAVAGHSLGELTAVAFAGCLSVDDALEAAVVRGELMKAAALKSPGAMAAVTCDEADVEELLALGKAHGSLDIAARNGPKQWVFSGDRGALGVVATAAPLTLLPVMGPWHTPAMGDAARHWEYSLRRFRWTMPTRPLFLAGTARPARGDVDWARVLAEQLYKPVPWMQILNDLHSAGVTRFIAVEPGRVLLGLCRETLGRGCEIVPA